MFAPSVLAWRLGHLPPSADCVRLGKAIKARKRFIRCDAGGERWGVPGGSRPLHNQSGEGDLVGSVHCSGWNGLRFLVGWLRGTTSPGTKRVME